MPNEINFARLSSPNISFLFDSAIEVTSWWTHRGNPLSGVPNARQITLSHAVMNESELQSSTRTSKHRGNWNARSENVIRDDETRIKFDWADWLTIMIAQSFVRDSFVSILLNRAGINGTRTRFQFGNNNRSFRFYNYIYFLCPAGGT